MCVAMAACAWGRWHVCGDSSTCAWHSSHLPGDGGTCAWGWQTNAEGQLASHLHGDSLCLHGDGWCVHMGQPGHAQRWPVPAWDSGCMCGDSCHGHGDSQYVHRDSQYVHRDSLGHGWRVHNGDAGGGCRGSGQEECPHPDGERCCSPGATLGDVFGGSGRRAWSLLLAQGVGTHPA